MKIKKQFNTNKTDTDMDSISEPDLKRSRRMRGDHAVNTDRLPPHDAASEMAVIGCQLSPRRDSISVVAEKTRSDVSVFYDLRHQEIQRVIYELTDAGRSVDIISVQSALKNKNLLDQAGGIPYLSAAQDAAEFLESNLEEWLGIICGKWMLRRAILIASNFVGKVYDDEGNITDLMDSFERDVLALRQANGNGDMKPIRQIVSEALVDIEAIFNRNGGISGLSTGLIDLDKETDGLHGGEYILIAAFPSDGKTSLAMNIVEHVILELGLPVGVFSAEMSALSLVKRSLCSVGRVNMRDIRQGRMCDGDFPRLMTASGRLSGSKLHIDDTSDMTIQTMRSKARRMVQQHGVKLIVADYAQLFSSPGAENRTNELDQVSKGFKNMAKELNVPVIVLSQLTEDAKGNVHLKGARALGEDADGYWHLKKPKDFEKNSTPESAPMELWLRKQRNEARGICINLTFLKTYTRFEQASKFTQEESRNPHND